MKVSELIAVLSEFPSDNEVYVDSMDGDARHSSCIGNVWRNTDCTSECPPYVTIETEEATQECD